MVFSVQMPALGESVTEGTVTRWLKREGDAVEVDEPLLEVSTDKVDTEIPSPAAGVLTKIVAKEDDVVEVGGELGIIGEPTAPAPVAAAQAQAPTQNSAPSLVPAASGNSEFPSSTPLVRKLAAENGVDLSTVKGSGVGGRIRKQDVVAAAEALEAPPAPAVPHESAVPAAPAAAPKTPAAVLMAARPGLEHLSGTTQKASRIRQIIATKTLEALQTTAQQTQGHEADLTKVAALRSRAKEGFAAREGVNLTFLPFFAKAAVEALGVHPNINASYNPETGEIIYHSTVNLGIAVDSEQGLLSPVIHNANDLSLAGLARAIADIANRARTGGLKPDEMAGSTFTITNIGSQGALFDTPILLPPQSAMLGVGAIVKRPMVIADNGNEFIGIRSMAFMPLTYDRRLVDRADAGRFVTTIKHRLEEAAFEADLGL
ncbi:2-oxoglutarate dehydrogenase, E2 component, dihydrolipoamide succinyltransferase [Nocardia amikacinitolerans]|uniref:2-oxoglutarate dehydrogenase, E2 component, dihydrolipoamide succinyltransferase n=1 Tax=Nocardia amikacinitolerans TaxID=756689 RepID=UPI0036A343EB